MILSRILMILALAVLAYLVYFTLSDKTEGFKTQHAKVKSEEFTQNKQIQFNHQPLAPVNKPKINYETFQESVPEVPAPAPVQEQVPSPVQEQVLAPAPVKEQAPVAEQAPLKMPSPQEANNIKYEKPGVVSGMIDPIHGAAPFGSNKSEDGDFATVKYTGMVDGNPGDVIQIEGTDLLTAPLVDNMLYTNSIANTNRNASQDLRGDISLQFNESYTPFYSSVIYGAPLSQKTMTIGTL